MDTGTRELGLSDSPLRRPIAAAGCCFVLAYNPTPRVPSTRIHETRRHHRRQRRHRRGARRAARRARPSRRRWRRGASASCSEVAARSARAPFVVPTDVTRRADVERLRDRAIEAFGHVDVWVNNAGRGITKPVLELTDDELDQMMTVNVKSALYGMQAIVPHFIARGRGQIVNVSSFLSRVPFATFRSAYNAAKAALNALTANARVDLARAHPGIHVTLVMPGLVSHRLPAQRARRHAAAAAVARRRRRPRRRRPRSSRRSTIRSPRSTPTRAGRAWRSSISRTSARSSGEAAARARRRHMFELTQRGDVAILRHRRTARPTRSTSSCARR